MRETALSPDGKFIVWGVGGRGGSGLSLAPFDNPAAAKRITACTGGDKGQESNAVFSPDSHQLAFFSDCNATHKIAIFIADPAGSAAPHQLVELNGFAKEMQWSPDGRRLSFLYVGGATRPSGALAAEKLPSGVIGVEGLEGVLARGPGSARSTGRLRPVRESVEPSNPSPEWIGIGRNRCRGVGWSD